MLIPALLDLLGITKYPCIMLQIMSFDQDDVNSGPSIMTDRIQV